MLSAQSFEIFQFIKGPGVMPSSRTCIVRTLTKYWERRSLKHHTCAGCCFSNHHLRSFWPTSIPRRPDRPHMCPDPGQSWSSPDCGIQHPTPRWANSEVFLLAAWSCQISITYSDPHRSICSTNPSVCFYAHHTCMHACMAVNLVIDRCRLAFVSCDRAAVLVADLYISKWLRRLPDVIV